MKCPGTVGLALVALAAGHAVDLKDTRETPMAKLVTVLADMKNRIVDSGKAEQASYDKYSCWCEETLAQKASDITKAKQKIEDLETDIVKNKGLLGSGGATIGKLKRDIAENSKARQEATEVRDKEHGGYSEGKNSAEQGIGALEQAIKVLSTAGSGKKGFLETLQEAKLMSVVATMRPIMETDTAKKMKGADLEVVQRFVSKPEDFFRGQPSQSALQTGNNPFGDYAAGSTKIQGVLKHLYDDFVGDLERDNVDEANKQESYEVLMATKRKEYDTLQDSLRQEKENYAERTRAVAIAKGARDDTKAQLDADGKFFTETKENCETKAKHWAQRTRLRSQEVSGIQQAVDILSSEGAKKTFESATKFLQLASEPGRVKHPRVEAYKRFKSMATRYQDIKLAQMAVAAKTTGHFDDIIEKCDKMIGVLREEEAEDITHRDRCEAKQNDNRNSMEEAERGIQNAKTEMNRLDQAMKDKKDDIKEIEAGMAKTQKNIDDITSTRKREAAEYAKSRKDDEDSIALLEKAEAAVVKFYKDTSFAQGDAKPAPHTSFDDEGGNYKGFTSQAKGVLATFAMIKEDLGKELKVSGEAESDAQVAYVKSLNTLKEIWRTGNDARTSAVVELSNLKSDNQEASQTKDSHSKDLSDEKKLKVAINTDCQWVKAQFDKRRKARKEEMDGLVGAKDFLAGVGTDTDLSFSE